VITGRRDDGAWLRVCCTTGGTEGWVGSRLLQVNGPLQVAEVVKLPTSTAAPTRPPARTPSPRPTATPRLVACVQGNVMNVAGASGLRGWTVRLHDATGAVKTMITSPSGFYRFTELAPGTVSVNLEVAAGWRMVSPQLSTVVVAPGATCAVVDFWGEQAPGEGPAPEPTPLR
jgi:hypothetical protein